MSFIFSGTPCIFSGSNRSIFLRYRILNKIPKCTMCVSGLFTEKHVFQICIYFKEQRKALIDRVKNVKPDIIINSVFYKFGDNTQTNNATDFFITVCT